jgi:polygalacturonase
LSRRFVSSAAEVARWPDAYDDPWLQVPGILARIKAPVFARRDFPVTRFGAVGNARADCTEAFARAIAACNKAGGGRVIVPEGEFVTGAIDVLIS